MSTGLECEFVEASPGSWYYILQDWNCPAQCWDWREYATAYGSFPSLEVAEAHLRRHHANPGGHSVSAFDPGRPPDEVERALFAEART